MDYILDDLSSEDDGKGALQAVRANLEKRLSDDSSSSSDDGLSTSSDSSTEKNDKEAKIPPTIAPSPSKSTNPSPGSLRTPPKSTEKSFDSPKSFPSDLFDSPTLTETKKATIQATEPDIGNRNAESVGQPPEDWSMNDFGKSIDSLWDETKPILEEPIKPPPKKPPPTVANESKQLKQEALDFSSDELGRKPAPSQLAKALSIPKNPYAKAKQTQQKKSTASKEKPAKDGAAKRPSKRSKSTSQAARKSQPAKRKKSSSRSPFFSPKPKFKHKTRELDTDSDISLPVKRRAPRRRQSSSSSSSDDSIDSKSSKSSNDSFAMLDKEELAAIDQRVNDKARQRQEEVPKFHPPPSSPTRLPGSNEPVATEGPLDAFCEMAEIDQQSPPPEEEYDQVYGLEQQPVDARTAPTESITEYAAEDEDWRLEMQQELENEPPSPPEVNRLPKNKTLSPPMKDRVEREDSSDIQDSDEDTFRMAIEPDERLTEVHPSFYEPQPCHPRRHPTVHYFSTNNRPVESRPKLPVHSLFGDPIRSMWKGKFDTFNQLQSEVANAIAYSDDNMVVSAPTGAGKTAVFEMAMARFFDMDMQQSGTRRSTINKSRKIVYVAPSKALCEERFDDWSLRLSSMNLGLEVALITGDGDPSLSFRDLASSHLILTTPEKWDSLTRRWTENFFLFGSVKLLLIDEVHLLADTSRGNCMEAICTRMKSIQRAAQQVSVSIADIQGSSYIDTTPEAFNSAIRTVAVSATLPNIAEIAQFLEANEAHVFDDSYRPVPLTTHVVGQGFVGNSSTNQYRFWSSFDRNVPELVHRFSKKKPTLIFCHSKADTEKLADMLALERGIGLKTNETPLMAGKTRVSKLQRVLLHGVAYHHAGLESDDRHHIEDSFIKGKIRVLCATSTLAMGVNLPAHLVIIKGTKAWRGGGSGYQDLDQATLLQMIGRAGRPGFDTTGTAVIMTDNKSKPVFEKLATSGLEPAMSKLTRKLDEIINTEISQNVITSPATAMNWIKRTLFAVQLQSDPRHFGVSHQQTDDALFELVNESVCRLQTVGSVASGHETLFALPASHTMSQHMVAYQAMALFKALRFDINQYDLLKTLCEIEGLHRPVRRAEKRVLKEGHKSIKHQMKGPKSKLTIQKPSEKAFVLLQMAIGRIHLEDFSLRQEMSSMADFLSRMLSALEEYSVRSTKHGIIVLESLRLRRSLATCLWTASDDVLTQLKGMGSATALNLRFAGIKTFEDVLNSTEEEIQVAAKCPAPFGSDLKVAVSRLMNDTLRLRARICEGSHVVCEVVRSEDFTTPASQQTPGVTYTLVGYIDKPGGCIFYQRNVTQPATYKAKLPESFGKISVHLVASLVGLDGTKHNTRKHPSHFFSEKIELAGNESVLLTRKNVSSTKTTGQHARIRNAGNRTKIRVTPSPKLSDTREEAPQFFPPRQQERPAPLSSIVPETQVQQRSARQSNKTSPFMRAVASRRPELQRDIVRETDQWTGDEPVASERRVPQQFTQQRARQHQAPFSPHQSGASRGDSSYYTRPSLDLNGDQTSSKWRKNKFIQQKSQQRAFVSKKDNPFSAFKHDPNDVEARLSHLSKQNETGIIPLEGLRELEKAYDDRESQSVMQSQGREGWRHQRGKTSRSTVSRRSSTYVGSQQASGGNSVVDFLYHEPLSRSAPPDDWNSLVGSEKWGESQTTQTYGHSSRSSHDWHPQSQALYQQPQSWAHQHSQASYQEDGSWYDHTPQATPYANGQYGDAPPPHFGAANYSHQMNAPHFDDRYFFQDGHMEEDFSRHYAS